MLTSLGMRYKIVKLNNLIKDESYLTTGKILPNNGENTT